MSCTVFGRDDTWIQFADVCACTHVSMHARESTHRSSPRDHSIRYDRSRLSLLQLQYPTRIVSVELTNGPPAQSGFRRVINDIISARLVDTFVFKFT